jgi:predicted 3-demethylubiquinone-9 3-methyltransferase (glyoxalase superfamily)
MGNTTQKMTTFLMFEGKAEEAMKMDKFLCLSLQHLSLRNSVGFGVSWQLNLAEN